MSWDVFYKLDIFEAFKYPVRDKIGFGERPFNLSIPYIFLIDIFGDYHLYGKFRYLDKSSYFECVPYLNRISILLGLVFFSLIILSSAKTFYSSFKVKIDKVDLFLIYKFFMLFLYLLLQHFMR